MNAAGVLASAGAVFLVVIGQALLKWGMLRVGPIGRSRLRRPMHLAGEVARTWQVWAGIGVYAVSAAVWILALSRVPLSVAYPVFAFTYVGVPIASTAVFDESLTPAQWLGILLAVAGVIIVAVG
jgi:multidrug transporter EmrE-like cation transporter